MDILIAKFKIKNEIILNGNKHFRHFTQFIKNVLKRVNYVLNVNGYKSWLGVFEMCFWWKLVGGLEPVGRIINLPLWSITHSSCFRSSTNISFVFFSYSVLLHTIIHITTYWLTVTLIIINPFNYTEHSAVKFYIVNPNKRKSFYNQAPLSLIWGDIKCFMILCHHLRSFTGGLQYNDDFRNSLALTMNVSTEQVVLFTVYSIICWNV